MINYNGNTIKKDEFNNLLNRGYLYGDSVFETLKVNNSKILFLEDHYFRLMASMRILRMEIPENFTMEFLEEQVINTLKSNSLLEKPARVKININRKSGGLYLPKTNAIDYIISASILQTVDYKLNESNYKVDLFKDFFVASGLLSTLKTNNKAVNVIGSIYASENELENCLLLNTEKSVIEALNANLFLVKGNEIKTPPIIDGCLNGIMRKQIIEIIQKDETYNIIEESISAFELQQADELFLTNVIQGVQPITNYRKKSFTTLVSKELIEKLNRII